MRAPHIAMIVLGSLTAGAQSPTENLTAARNGRWGLGGAADLFVVPHGSFQADDELIDRSFFAAGLSVRWYKSARTS